MTDLTNYLDCAVDYLVTTCGGLTEKAQAEYAKHIDAHANDLIESGEQYADLTPAEKDELINQMVATYRSL